MQRSNIKDFFASVFTITSVIVFTFAVFYALHFSPVSGDQGPQESLQTALNSIVKLPEEKATSTRKESKGPPALPATLSIPSISVNATVEHVGRTKTGNMAVPSNAKNVGWYKYGTVPGAAGTAVIDGHLDSSWGTPAVFARLDELRPGDEIVVKRNDDRKLRFRVTRTDIYSYNDPDAAKAIFKDEDSATIRLITCDGTWISSANSYSKRLVVTAELI